MTAAQRLLGIPLLMVASGALLLAQHGGGAGGHGGSGGAHGGGGAHGTGFASRSGSSIHTGTPAGLPGSAYSIGIPASAYSIGIPASAYSIGVPAPGFAGARGFYPGSSNSYGANGSYVYGPWRSQRGYGRRGYGYLGAPYFPLWALGDDYGYDDPGYGNYPPPYSSDYQQGPPMQDPMGVSDQLQQLSAQVNDLQNRLGQGGGMSGPAIPQVRQDALPPSPPLTVVLTTGQTLKVENYAVMGSTLWDFSSQPVRKIPFSRINIEASSKASEANGAEFPQLGGGK